MTAAKASTAKATDAAGAPPGPAEVEVGLLTPGSLESLREPFPASVVGVLPQPLKKDAEKGTCNVCGQYHGLPAMHIDYVGHAAVTDRLLTIDPHWTWEPFALDAQGLPALDRTGGLWIRLTILDMTRIGYGDGKSTKEIIGDAIRNAAMRFGVALELWTKNELESKAPNSSEQPPDDPTAEEFLGKLTRCTSLAVATALRRDAGLAGVLPDVVRVTTTEGDVELTLGEAFDRRMARMRAQQEQSQ